MGKHNSSSTRVVPVFDKLFASDPSGASWLDALIELGSRHEIVSTISGGQRLVPGHRRCWGMEEIALPAPESLLEYLVQNISFAQVNASKKKGDTLVKRTALASRDPAIVAEALATLRSGKRGRKWFVLEGESRPDAFLETEQLVICIEGKRTERTCTTHTTWMPRRSQLVRHMDAARDAYPGKRVLGLLIVEGDGSRADAVAPSASWCAESAAQYAPKMLRDSLPHRSDVERAEIEAGILGVTTWQAVCARNHLPWPPAPDPI